ncbi:MAG: hypothetical protein AAGC99_13655, partial [Pseudomonadota bacterium]
SKIRHGGPDLRRDAAAGGDAPHHQQVESYGGGHIEARHGRVNLWLAIVYLVMFVWAIYYGFKYWGGLGPGLDY